MSDDDECPKFKTIEARKSKIKGSCYICLKQGHKSSECRLNKLCVHCGENNSHLRSLCPRKFPLNSRNESVQIVEEIVVNDSENRDISPSENVLISSNEMVLMQTALSDIQNKSSGDSEQVRLLLDCGSQRSYISESLAN